MIRLKNILIIDGIMIIPILIFIFDWNFDCIFRQLFNVNCPGCGLTRSLIYLLNGDLLTSFYYNILTIPLIIISLILIIWLVIDTINNTDNCLNKLLNFFQKYYFIIIVILILVIIINNIHHI